jgi:hypothetical protein
MKKGIVMDMNDSFLTLLTPEGEFLHARKQNISYQIGEEIHFFPIESETNSRSLSVKSFLRLKPIGMVSILAAFGIFFGTLIPIYHDNKAYAYMSIDANPSIELGINKNMQVVELTGYNKDGKRVITSLHNWKKQDVSQLTETILNKMKKAGYLHDNQSVIISTVLTDDPGTTVKEQLKENISEIKESAMDKHLDVTIYNSTEKEREEAKKLGMTSGKYHEDHLTSYPVQKENGNKVQEGQGKVDKNAAEPAVTAPPGQIKKQVEIPSKDTNGNENNLNKDNNKDTKVPPGQLKKNSEESGNLNFGQLKKNDESSIKKNPGQLKKITENPQKQSYLHKESSNNKYQSNHKEKH